MPVDTDALGRVRDLLLVTAIAVVMVMLNVAIAEPESGNRQPATSERGQFTSGQTAADFAEPMTSDERCRCFPKLNLSPPPAPPSQVRPAFVPGDGVRDPLATRDPGDPRRFILETASTMHRRSWIALVDPEIDTDRVAVRVPDAPAPHQ